MNQGTACPGEPGLVGTRQLGIGAGRSLETGSPTSDAICAIMPCIAREARVGRKG